MVRMLQVHSLLSLVVLLSLPGLSHADPSASLGQFSGRYLEFEHVKSPSKDFPLPKSLRKAVVFWEEVFITYEKTQLIIHDRENQNIIWSVYKVPADDGTKATRKLIQSQTDHYLDSVRAALQHLEDNGKPRNKWEAGAVQFLSKHSTTKPQPLHKASKRVRAQRGVSNDLRAGRKRAEPWLTKIEAELKKQGLPTEIALMTFVESMFNTKAHSSAGAAGIWQLMPATARELGLQVSRKKDERMDVLKATKAASKLLKRNYKMLESWPLAVTGYNHGAYGVKRAIRKVGSRKLEDLIEKYEKRSWGFASKNFYAELIAMIRIFNNETTTSNKSTVVYRKPS